ncbi:Oidioi.mRNA.OKI2018_I69.chr2.g8372.t1.cds [Oikopleura dioica]|uniref:Oidioi.mRNA.OKI2018_I69.chr2.g8372.t1.cds n=1 Tax=Oikopleura dioica TaxID=34765 RepID=A0ABN7TDH0_OIKDI|nr:Oidioi.mRNA.OKI2018_I69.chr2.g8372.t1.cds [Oikopleura dioica]
MSAGPSALNIKKIGPYHNHKATKRASFTFNTFSSDSRSISQKEKVSCKIKLCVAKDENCAANTGTCPVKEGLNYTQNGCTKPSHVNDYGDCKHLDESLGQSLLGASDYIPPITPKDVTEFLNTLHNDQSKLDSAPGKFVSIDQIIHDWNTCRSKSRAYFVTVTNNSPDRTLIFGARSYSHGKLYVNAGMTVAPRTSMAFGSANADNGVMVGVEGELFWMVSEKNNPLTPVDFALHIHIDNPYIGGHSFRAQTGYGNLEYHRSHNIADWSLGKGPYKGDGFTAYDMPNLSIDVASIYFSTDSYAPFGCSANEERVDCGPTTEDECDALQLCCWNEKEGEPSCYHRNL